MSDKTFYRLWPAIIGLAIGLRAFAITAPPLWYDEAWTLWVARLPLARSLAAIAGDVHPPLFMLIEWWVAHINAPDTSGEWIMRSYPFLFGVWAIYKLRDLGERLMLPRRVIVVAALIMALSPFQLYFSQEARMYALLQLLFLQALVYALSRRWMGLGAVNGLLLYTHNYGFIYAAVATIAAVCAWWLDWRRTERGVRPESLEAWRDLFTREWHRMCAWNAVAVAAYVPWLIYGLSDQLSSFKEGHWIRPVNLGSLFYPLFQFVFGASVSVHVQLFGFMLLSGILALGLWRLWRRRTAGALAALALCCAPIALAAAISIAWRPIFLYRALIGASAPLYLFLAWTASYRVSVVHRAWVVAMALPVMILGALLHAPSVYATKAGSHMGEVAAYIVEHWSDGDVIYHLDIGSAVETHEALADYPSVLSRLPDHSLGGYSHRTREALGLVEGDLSSVTARRIWFISTLGPVSYQWQENQLSDILSTTESANIMRWGDQFIDGGLWLIQP